VNGAVRLLLVEDDKRVARFIQKGLQAEYYSVDVAFDGQQGLEIAKVGTYDLVILDVLLPLRSGIEVCRQLREEKIQLPILMLTAKDSIEDRVQGLEVGADDYLVKPFAFEELVARVRSLLRRPKRIDIGQIVTVTDLTLDKNTHEVRRAGKLIQLTPREFSLLEYLMRYPDRVVSRTMIEEHVWGYTRDSLTNAVDVYIRRLRKKVNPPFHRKLISTIRGVGYRLKPEIMRR